ncbi:membrane hypothetical protein [Desulfamplus magnetovallimortis]|uniref:Cytochrome c assembly protein domain-containing protein n=1 Tax=Desulfamplus magnetovallimortis TaxID=1246637 RepID=A0A1W1HIK5_9BACT|nr:membrane hypothetical protein [Desulfamplus magnetovallimortis]
MTLEQSTTLLFSGATLLYAASMTAYLLFFLKQQNKLESHAYIMLCIGSLLHFMAIASTAFSMGTLPSHNLQQTLYTASLALSWVFILLKQKFNLKILGLFASPLILLMMIWAMLLPDTPPAQESFLKGFWLVAHIVLIFAGEAALALACGAGILYLVQEKAIKEKRGAFFTRGFLPLIFLTTQATQALLQDLQCLQWVLSQDLSMQKQYGEHSGAGIPRRYGQRSHGLSMQHCSTDALHPDGEGKNLQ